MSNIIHIYKCRGKTLDLKTHKSWKYDDKLCLGCKYNVDTENKLLVCEGYCEENEVLDDALPYDLVFSESVKDMLKVAKVIKKRDLK